MKQLLWALLSLLLIGVAQAQGSAETPYKKVAVTSLIGDVITVDTYRMRVGTMVDTNHQTKMPVQSPVFDEVAMKAASDAMNKTLPSTSLATLAPPAADSDLDPARFLIDGRIASSHRMVVALRDAGFTHLLVITKQRAPARLKVSGTAVGSGYLQGIGFYLDDSFKVQRVDTLERAVGLIAPYVYIKLALVDLNSLQQVREQVITENTTSSAAGHKEAFGAWEALTSEQKVSLLEKLIRDNVTAATPRLFKSN
jgi:hypothetical protein